MVKKTNSKTNTGSSKNKKTAAAKVNKQANQRINGVSRFTQKLSQLKRTISEKIHLPQDRKLDVIGIVLIILGLISLFCIFSPIQNSFSEKWVHFLTLIFGLGIYIFAFGILLIGIWLVLRKREGIPGFEFTRFLGLLLLFSFLLTIIDYIIFKQSNLPPFDLDNSEKAGGYFGAILLGLLLKSLGEGGAIIAFFTWFVISITLTFDLAIVNMVGWIPVLWENLQDWIIEITEEIRMRKIKPTSVLTNYDPMISNPMMDKTVSSADSEPIVHVSQEMNESAFQHWVLPDIKLILDEGGEISYNDELDLKSARVIEETLKSFGAPVSVVEINRGPTITQFGVEPQYIQSRNGKTRVRVNKITGLADDLALALAARTIRIQAPVPGKGYVGIEVPNESISLVALSDLINSEAFKRLQSPLRIALGLNVSGNAIAADLSVMPHLLIAGATGSGKSVCVNAIISCLLINNTPNDLRMIMIDPKRVELSNYNGIPHLLSPVVVELERVVRVLQWVTREMDMRYRKLAEANCRNIQEFNLKHTTAPENKLPYLVVIIDELADLMMLAPDETERTITRLAQLARATGIHLIIATQRPSVDVVTGLIKANFPARIAFAVASGTDSRVILDQPGAERLLGRGDMLFQAPDAPASIRLQGVFVSDQEIQRLVEYWRQFYGLHTQQSVAGGIVDASMSSLPLKQIPLWEDMEDEQNKDPLYDEAVAIIRQHGHASISMLQRRLRIGYTRAGRLIEDIEAKGIIGPPEPSTGSREVLDYGQAAPPVDD